MLPVVKATRYVTPLREGGSLPGLVEAADLGIYVAKFTGAGQGRKALIADIIAAELARRLGFRVPRLVLLDFDPVMARHEADEEVQDLLDASPGWNLGVDFLPGALNYDPLAWTPDAEFASGVLWFDAFIGNVDRSWRNPNMLVWHGEVWLIDHGASLYFHHAWKSADKLVSREYDVDDHVFKPYAKDVRGAESLLLPKITDAVLHEVLGEIPDLWMTDEPGFDSPEAVRAAYFTQLKARLAIPRTWLP
ncbi:HipA family kinase [Actinocorallia longicatena]|uniref:HipA-like kinase domain-containing protein n=1 Tax=Actinocorallia longicatena TaxID=111803 RepID=A0ABP6PY97_9ACTN